MFKLVMHQFKAAPPPKQFAVIISVLFRYCVNEVIEKKTTNTEKYE